ncbi:unnamed protein product [Brachionus calyciflorus]|uniref:Tetratricopeptide repeat protein 38 n=1 Tax=Brachionus calyciflorus TaxID=104777 RepID=A0A814EZT6_9BILA|nr:unnamed protein product [Brachionus calyciflorus]
MNTTSNDACKFFDITLNQLVTWREDDQFGGIEGSIEKMLNCDVDFILGHVLKSGIELIGSSANLSPSYSHNITHLTSLADKVSKNLTKRELLHVQAIINLYSGDINKSCDLWESILIEHPNDMLAIKFAHDSYFYLGQHPQMRDSISRVLPYWKNDSHLYGYLHGMHSFGYVQSNFFQEAKLSAFKALEYNPNDAWASHTLCHYNEYKNEFDSGIKFLRETEKDWSVCNLISPHNYWHLALYHLERDEHEISLEIFDEEISKTLNLNRTLDLVDLISLLYRLKLDNCKVDLKERWLKLQEVYMNRIHDHGYTFNDMHILLMLCACENEEGKKEFFDSFDCYLKEPNREDLIRDSCNNIIGTKKFENYLKEVNRKFGVNLFDAISYFEQKEYEKVVDCIKPIRYEIFKIGGSNAQRDLFHLILTQSALLSNNLEYKKFGINLVNERLGLKPNSNLTKRISNRFTNYHS